MNINEIKNKTIAGIYKINYPNGKSYIGQAKNIYTRLVEHNNYAKYGHGTRELLLCEKKMKEYNFYIEDFDLLETVDNLNLLDEKEIYWIDYYNTYIKNGQGYNLTRGGNASGKRGYENHFASLDKEKLDEVIDLLINHLEFSQEEIAKKYNVGIGTINAINMGKRYINLNLKYPLRDGKQRQFSQKNNVLDYFKSEKDLISLKEDLLYRWDLTIEQDLKEKYNVPLKILRDINNGRKFEDIGCFTYPIRTKNIRNINNFSLNDITNILNRLSNTTDSISQIAKDYNVTRNLIYKINKGQSYVIKDFIYPARKN